MAPRRRLPPAHAAHLRSAFFDPEAIRRVRGVLAVAEPDGAPAATLLYPEETAPALRRLGVFSGSFNPLTTAHTEVAARAHDACDLDLTAFALSTRTTDKEQATGLFLEDRLLTLLAFAQRRSGHGVLALNRGLYVEQATALHAAFPSLDRLYFVVGFDKIVQVFDPRYYTDRTTALDTLFSLASFIVAPRGADTAAELSALLDRPENRSYAGSVLPLAVPARFRDLSSTAVRDALDRGQPRVAGLPAESQAGIRATGAYLPAVGPGPSPHAVREPLLNALSRWPARLSDEQARRLERAVHDRGQVGERLREALALPEANRDGALRRLLDG